MYEQQLNNYQGLVDLLSTIVPQAFGSDPLVEETAYRRARFVIHLSLYFIFLSFLFPCFLSF